MSKDNSKRLTKLRVGIFAVGIIVLAGLFLGRGYIRSEAIPLYVKVFYKTGVDRHFNQDFPEITQQLKGLGFRFDQNWDSQDDCGRGTNIFYSGFGASVSCRKDITSNKQKLTDDFIANWEQHSNQFEEYLLANGWHKDWNAQQPIAQLYNDPDNRNAVAVHYSKSHGKTFCNLGVWYNADQPDPFRTFVIESCSRTVEFFGGPY